jgi:hypothetical protein
MRQLGRDLALASTKGARISGGDVDHHGDRPRRRAVFSSRTTRSGEPEPVSGVQFRGAMETLKVLPWWLPQLLQRSLRSRSSSLVYGGRPCCSSLASM